MVMLVGDVSIASLEVVRRYLVLISTEASDLVLQARHFLAQGAHEFFEFLARSIPFVHLSRFAQLEECW